MKIRLIGNCLIITTNQKPKKNDWMCTLQVGYTNQRTGRIVIPKKRFIYFHDGSNINKLRTITHGTEKILLKICIPKLF
jgi:hypothetical protein